MSLRAVSASRTLRSLRLWRRTVAARLWKVEIHRRLASSSGSMWARRSRISPAALRVKVTRAISSGEKPSLTRRAARWVTVRVLPLPGPAMTRAGPKVCPTTACCSLLSTHHLLLQPW